jgi:hypothetical protein
MFDSITGRGVPVCFFIVRGRASGYFMHASKSLRSSWHAWALLPCSVATPQTQYNIAACWAGRFLFVLYCPMSLVWLELLELMKGRSDVSLTQFSSSIVGYYMPRQKGFMGTGEVGRHYTTSHLLNTCVGCCYFQAELLCWWYFRVEGLGISLKPLPTLGCGLALTHSHD